MLPRDAAAAAVTTAAAVLRDATVSRSNLGSLMTTWTPRSDCSLLIADCDTCTVARQAQYCLGGTMSDNSDCWPSTTSGAPTTSAPFDGWGFYSPGVACPSGYASACTQMVGSSGGFSFQFALTTSETAIGCCPSGYSCALDTNAKQTCQVVETSSSFWTGTCRTDSSNIAFSFKTVPFTATVLAASSTTVEVMPRYTLYAPLVQIVHQASDVNIATTPSATASAVASATSGAQNGTSTSAADSSGHLSSGAAAGIGIGAAAAIIIIIVLAYLYMRAKRHAAEAIAKANSGTRGLDNSSTAPVNDSYQMSPQDTATFASKGYGFDGHAGDGGAGTWVSPMTATMDNQHQHLQNQEKLSPELAAGGEHTYHELDVNRGEENPLWSRAMAVNDPHQPVELSSYKLARWGEESRTT